MVIVYVGKKRKEYCLHRKILCSKSPYFESKFGKLGYSCNEIYMVDESVFVFDMFVDWLYGRDLAELSALRDRSHH